VTARLRPELADLPAYTPGRNVPGAIKIASNETVDGPLPSVRIAIEKATELINRYPDNGYAELRDRLAKYVNFAPEHISVGSGSVSLCQQLIQITSTVGDEVLFGWRSFEIYPLQVRTAGATPIQVPLTDYTFDLDAMLAAITDRTRLIFVCNPNNPTSTVVDPDALARFVDAVPSDILATARRPTASNSSAIMPTSLCYAPFRRPTGWPDCASDTPSAIRSSSPRSERSTCRSPRPACLRPRPSRHWMPRTSCWRAPMPSSPSARG